MSYKGRFRPKNPSKYRGDPLKIIYRSLLEYNFFVWMDEHPEILWWQSEEVIVPYLSQIDGKMHRYYPDVVMCKKVKDKEPEIFMIEIKPFSQTFPPDVRKKNNTPTGRVSRRYLNEVKRWGVNDSKWKAAENYCAARGWKFIKLTEKDLNMRY